MRPATPPSISWPDGKRFAFTIFDDADFSTVEDGRPLYDLLTSLGLRITKAVWPSEPVRPRATGGETCADPAYVAWLRELQADGHEMAYHNATDHPSVRDETVAALDRFREVFGADPAVGADHGGNLEALYWGPNRLSGWRRHLYRLAERVEQPARPVFSGEDPDSPYFWGDLARDRITYWRNFTFDEVDLLRVCPDLPYHDPERPFVNQWFPATHAPDRRWFCEVLTPERIDRLERDGGVCIVYTHFGLDFVDDGRVDPQVAAILRDVARRDGWFAPVSAVLDHVRA